MQQDSRVWTPTPQLTFRKKYIGKYAMKEDSTSEATVRAKTSVTKDYCDRHAGGNKSIVNIVGKHMNELANGEPQFS